MIYAGVQAAVADGDGLVERWRDLGPAMCDRRRPSRRACGSGCSRCSAPGSIRGGSRPGPATLDVAGRRAAGSRQPAHHRLGPRPRGGARHARRPRRPPSRSRSTSWAATTYVRLRPRPAPGTRRPAHRLRGDGARATSGRWRAQTGDGRVPGRGPVDRARADRRKTLVAPGSVGRSSPTPGRRGLSRPRWSPGLKAVPRGLAVPVALAVSVAVSTLPDDPADERRQPVRRGALWMRLVGFGALSASSGELDGERDTPGRTRGGGPLAGRPRAARRGPAVRRAAAGGGGHLGPHPRPRHRARASPTAWCGPLPLGAESDRRGVELGRRPLAGGAGALPAGHPAGVRTPPGAGPAARPRAPGDRSPPRPARPWPRPRPCATR